MDEDYIYDPNNVFNFLNQAIPQISQTMLVDISTQSSQETTNSQSFSPAAENNSNPNNELSASLSVETEANSSVPGNEVAVLQSSSTSFVKTDNKKLARFQELFHASTKRTDLFEDFDKKQPAEDVSILDLEKQFKHFVNGMFEYNLTKTGVVWWLPYAEFYCLFLPKYHISIQRYQLWLHKLLEKPVNTDIHTTRHNMGGLSNMSGRNTYFGVDLFNQKKELFDAMFSSMGVGMNSRICAYGNIGVKDRSTYIESVALSSKTKYYRTDADSFRFSCFSSLLFRLVVYSLTLKTTIDASKNTSRSCNSCRRSCDSTWIDQCSCWTSFAS